MQDMEELKQAAATVLQQNDRETFTVPAEPLYPHQWLWDSAFIAIGLRHINPQRAKTELDQLFKAQWTNGMIPHVIHAGEKRTRDSNVWRSWMNPHAPEDISTSGITQPPILAEAVVRVAESLDDHERKSWLKQVYPVLERYHMWLYTERDPHNEGLALQIHPWETGLDNTPPWMRELHDHQLPLWVQSVKSLRLTPLFNLFRNDTKIIPAHQRMSTVDALALYSVQRRLRRKNYDINRILAHSLFAIEDLTFNAIFIRNNTILRDIAEEIQQPIGDELKGYMEQSEEALQQLWDPYSGQYYSREFVSHKMLKESSIATLVALYAGVVPEENADQLVKLLEDEHMFGPPFPVPSMPVGSNWFQEHGYWQGPTWVNTNWLIIDGLERHGYKDHAEALTQSTLEMIAERGFYEYFSPLDGSPAGAENFSWTAAIAIDLANRIESPSLDT